MKALLLGVGCLECSSGDPLDTPRWFGSAAEARAVAEREYSDHEAEMVEWMKRTGRSVPDVDRSPRWDTSGGVPWLLFGSDYGLAVVEVPD